MEPLWKKWLRRRPISERDSILFAAISRLMELEEVSFRIDDSVRDDGTEIPEDETVEECLYWDSCGEDLRGD